MIKTKVLILSFFISLTHFINAQQQIIDSLELQLKKPTNGLSEIEILNELSWYYYAQSNAEIGIEKANMVISKAIAANDSLQLGLAHERKGLNYQKQGKDSVALSQYAIANSIYSKIKHFRRLATLNYNLGFFHMKRANYNKSIENNSVALDIFITNKDTLKIARTLNIIGLDYLYLGDYTQAQEKFKKSLLFLDNTNRNESLFYAEIISNEGLLEEKLSHFSNALELQQKALEIHQKNKNKSGIASTLNNIGKLNSKLGNKKSALEYFKRSYELKKEIGNQYRIANVLSNIGTIYSELNEEKEALYNLNKAKEIYKKLNHETNLSTIYKNIGEIYLEINKIDFAKKYFDSSLVFALNAKDKRVTYLTKEALGNLYYKTKNYKKAFEFQNEANEIKDSLLSSGKRDEIAQLKAKYEYDKEKAILQANFDKDKAIDKAKIAQEIFIRNATIGAGVTGILILIIGFALIKRKRDAEHNEKLAASKLETIKAQLNPHFIFNTLNSINDYVQKNDSQSASRYLTRFSKMMRNTLDFSKETEVAFEDELNFIENYIQLEQQRLHESFSYTIEVSEAIDKENIFIAPALLQPFIENSIWHGFSTLKDKDGLLEIDITPSKLKNRLSCTIKDNGIGVTAKKSHHKSFGVSSTQERLNLINTIKGNTHTKIEVTQNEEGFSVNLLIPYTLETE